MVVDYPLMDEGGGGVEIMNMRGPRKIHGSNNNCQTSGQTEESPKSDPTHHIQFTTWHNQGMTVSK